MRGGGGGADGAQMTKLPLGEGVTPHFLKKVTIGLHPLHPMIIIPNMIVREKVYYNI